MNTKYYWNEETLQLFRELIELDESFENIKKEVEIFVHRDCILEDNETEEMLVKDLLNQIYQNNE
tara:strand:+ start:62 stop:256 length:195 start_codon:yes stop_codon:yes gene_type:complete